jgi:hypothetical protein
MEDHERCLHCDAAIVDPTTQVVHGGNYFCCTNCSTAWEQVTGGTDPQAPGHANDLFCERCEARLVDDSTIEEHDGRPYCCRNCAAAAGFGLQQRTA